MIYYGCCDIVIRKEKILKNISNVILKLKKFNVKNTVRYINITFKMVYEINKICQLNYYLN